MPTFKRLTRRIQNALQDQSKKEREEEIRREIEAFASSSSNDPTLGSDLQQTAAGPLIPQPIPLDERQSEPFEYQPLDPNEMQFRLFTLRRSLHLKPGNSLTAGNLRNYSMYDCPQYIALSYEWGKDSDPEYTVDFATGSVRIRENLWRLLVVLSRTSFRTENGKDLSRHVWVDQISINQPDDQERSSQVQLMGLIYRHADSVVAWPGHILEYYKPRHSGDPILENSLALVQARYWRRLWIIQELVLANKIQFLSQVVGWKREEDEYPTYTVDRPDPVKFKSWENLLAGLEESNKSSLAQADRHFKGIVAHRAQNSRDQLLTLSAAISQYSDSGCLDPRDRIFGLLGIVREEQRVVVDYSLTALEVFETAITKALMTESNATNGLDQAYEIIFSMLAQDMGLAKSGQEGMSALLDKYRQPQQSKQYPRHDQTISAVRRTNSFG